MPGLLVVTGLIVAVSALRAGGAAKETGMDMTRNPAGYIQVRGESKEYFLEMPQERMKAGELLHGFAKDLWIESGDAVGLSGTRRGGQEVVIIHQGMDNLTRYVLGLKMELNRATARELSLVPGLGLTRAERILERSQRRGGYTGWEGLKSDPEVTEEIYSALMDMFFLFETDIAGGGAHAEPSGGP